MKKLLILTMAMSLLLTACNSRSAEEEKQAFVDATVEATCMIFQSEDINDPVLQGKAREVFVKHGFDVENEEKLRELADKYKDQDDVQNMIAEGLDECTADAIKELEETLDEIAGEEEADDAAEESEEASE